MIVLGPSHSISRHRRYCYVPDHPSTWIRMFPRTDDVDDILYYIHICASFASFLRMLYCFLIWLISLLILSYTIEYYGNYLQYCSDVEHWSYLFFFPKSMCFFVLCHSFFPFSVTSLHFPFVFHLWACLTLDIYKAVSIFFSFFALFLFYFSFLVVKNYPTESVELYML